MDRLRALEILALLADGVDPYTGEQYPIDSPYQHPDTVRALYAAIAGLDRPVAPVKKSAKVESTESGPEKAGKPWSADEDELLRGEAGQALDLKLIADTHGRTPGAISARLVRLGLFPDRETARTALTR